MLMLAGGGEACSDIEYLRSQGALFGEVASDTTFYRTLTGINTSTRSGLWEAMARIRSRVWSRAGATVGSGPVTLDLDASLHEVHSENKEHAAAHFKGGYGFHPLYCTADATGEVLGVRLRSGNAGANTIADHEAVLDQAIAGLPAEIAAGHRRGDDPGLVKRAVHVRTDSAGCSGFVWRCRDRNVGFSVVARSNAKVHAAISRVAYDSKLWVPALTQAGAVDARAEVIDVTEHADMTAWPSGTRLIVRRERRHPGAQHSLFESEIYRYWGHYTDAEGDPAELDAYMRAHAHVEDNIRRLKDSGAQRFPFSGFEANQMWLDLVCFADALVRWFQHICCDNNLAKAEPKTLRWSLWHTPARVVTRARRQIIRIIAGWPTANDIENIYKQIALIT